MIEEMNTNYYRIKVADKLAMSKAKRLKFVGSAGTSWIYSTATMGDKDEVVDYLKGLGISPEAVSRLSLENMT